MPISMGNPQVPLEARVGFASALIAGLVVLASVAVVLAFNREPWTSIEAYTANFEDVHLIVYVLWLTLAVTVVAVMTSLHCATSVER